MEHTSIRYRADGSIDTGYYLAEGRRHRSDTLHRMVRSIMPPDGEARAGRTGYFGLFG